MRSSRTSERWTKLAALFVLIGHAFGAGGAAVAAAGQDTLLQPTPLVLKDGRIANVSIHVLPFDRSDGELSGDAAGALARLTAEIATDCFLTAQVIGHVSSREVADNETLAAHRLARSRADAVQSSLIGGGLPAKSIASVWDWQFLVREPRATLWVFRLIEGEDCEGLPLDGGAPQLVADAVPAQSEPSQAPMPDVAAPAAKAAATAQPVNPSPMPPADPAPQVAVAQAPPAAPAPEPVAQTTIAALPPMLGSAVAAEATPQPDGVEETPVAVAAGEAPGDAPAAAEKQVASNPLPGGQARGKSADAQGRRQQVAAPAGPAHGAMPTVTRPIPALSPSPAAAVAADEAQAEATVAALEPRAVAAEGTQGASTAAPAAEPNDPKRQGKVEWGQDGNVVITFATNSSYFPPGTTRRLSTMLNGMTGDQRYHVQLQVGVSGTDKVVGATSPEEARRYNQWLAERRMARVQEWLAENAQNRQLEIEPVFVADDSSRRVLVRIVPVS